MVATKTERQALQRGMAGRFLKRFARREDGSAIVFTLFLLSVLLIVTGYAVDTMRFENQRARLQATLDRAVLAAADLEQPLAPDAVVRDYFAKAGLLNNINNITVTQTANSRLVSVTASVDIETLFMQGLDTLVAPASGAATEAISDIEIALVLDISGSMNSNNRLTNLKLAASDFVDTVLANDVQNRISIAIVPFNGQVNLGPTLRAQYNAIDNPNVANVNCIDLPGSVYNQLPLSNTLAMPMTAHADTFTATSFTTSYVAVASGAPNGNNRWCPPSSTNIVRLPMRNITTLKNNINALTAIGATSINAGMRWGVALLDPASRPMFNNLIGGGHIPSFFSGRPFDYGRSNTMKVVVLMTDGEHFAEERVNAGYRTGLAPIWRSTGDGNYSIRFLTGRPAAAGTNTYWVPHLCTSSACTSGSNTAEAWRANPWNNGSGVTQQTWPQVWSTVRTSWVAWQLYARALGNSSTTRTNIYNTWMDNFRTLTPTTTMDNQLQTICTQAKTAGIIVFGIAFEAPANGQTQIAGCASSPSHYYNAAGTDIRTVFRTIASQITALRLVQ